MDCPKCVGKLQKKEVVVQALPKKPKPEEVATSFELQIDQCFVCGGVWFDKGELDKYLADQINIINSPSLGKELDQKLDQKEGKCPRCHLILKKQPAPRLSDMQMGVCLQCQGIWLDSTEIDRLEKAHASKHGLWGAVLKAFGKKK